MAGPKCAALSRLRRGEVCLGVSFSLLRGPPAAQLAKAAGFHWLALDAEHGCFSLPEISDLCLAAAGCGISGIVRITRGDLGFAARALDVGADGIIAPMVEDADEAQALVQALRYPPQGARGYGGSGARFGFMPPAAHEAMALLNRETMLVALVESAKGIENVGRICAVEGVDAVFVGASDLCISLGIPGQFESAAFISAFEMVRDACAEHGKFLGLGGVYDDAMTRNCVVKGARLVAAGSEQSFFLTSARKRVEILNESVRDGLKTPLCPS